MSEPSGPFQIMGIVNVTPDSFSDGGQFGCVDEAVAHGLRLEQEGAAILDIGGESTRPGASEISVEQELRRVVPVVRALARQSAAKISIDSRKPEVAKAAVEEGAVIWNDVSALQFSPYSLATAAALGVDLVLMHASDSPDKMQDNPYYEDVVAEIDGFFAARLKACAEAGIEETKIILDPGIGFGKNLAHNLQLLTHLDQFNHFGRPLLLGASRKRFIAGVDAGAPVTERLGGSLAALLAGAARGVSIFRVHDVAATRQALAVYRAIEGAKTP